MRCKNCLTMTTAAVFLYLAALVSIAKSDCDLLDGNRLEMCSCANYTLSGNQILIHPQEGATARKCSVTINADPGLAVIVTQATVSTEMESACSGACVNTNKYLQIEDSNGASFCNCGRAKPEINAELFATNDNRVTISHLRSEFSVYVESYGCKTDELVAKKKRLSWNYLGGGPATKSQYFVNVTCESGFLLDNKDSWKTVRCIADSSSAKIGTWSEPNQRCKKATCERPDEIIANGNIVPLSTESFDFGADIEYKCNEGYELSTEGNSRRYCMTIHGVGAVWSGTAPWCQKVDCGKVPVIMNGRISSSGSPADTLYQARYFVTCDAGFILIGSNTFACQADKSWSPTPTCQSVNCGDPPVLEHGQWKTPGGSNNWTHSGILIAHCDTGYTVDPIVLNRTTCQINGTWTQAPICRIQTCGTEPDLEHGTCVDCTNSERTFTYQSKRDYQCNEGYKFQSSSSVECLAAGIWTLPSPCTEVTCGILPSVPNFIDWNINQPSYKYNTTAQLECKDGYFSEIGKKARCGGSGQWVEIPKCMPIDCGGVPLGEFLIPVELDYSSTFGSEVELACITGFERTSALKAVRCLKTGKWTPLPTCQIVDCGDPGDVIKILNGDYHDYYDKTYGAVIRFSCDDKYMFEDATNMTCQADGTWSPPPRCIETDCYQPDDVITAGRLVLYNDTKLDALAEYECLDGDTPTNTRVTARCLENGMWSYPSCQKGENDQLLYIFIGTISGIIILALVVIILCGICFKRRAESRKTKQLSPGSSQSHSSNETSVFLNHNHQLEPEDKPSIGSFTMRKSREDELARSPGPWRSNSLGRPRIRHPLVADEYPLNTMVSDDRLGDANEVVVNPLYAEHRMDRLTPGPYSPSPSYQLPYPELNDLNNEMSPDDYLQPRSQANPYHGREPNIMDHQLHDGYSTTNPNYFRNYSPRSHNETPAVSPQYSQTLPFKTQPPNSLVPTVYM